MVLEIHGHTFMFKRLDVLYNNAFKISPHSTNLTLKKLSEDNNFSDRFPCLGKNGKIGHTVRIDWQRKRATNFEP